MMMLCPRLLPSRLTRRLQWFALAVKPGCEKAVARSLRSRGLEEYVPIYSGRRRLFPGFVFCRFDYQNRRAVIEIPGVLSIAGPCESASPISDAEIAWIKMIMAAQLPAKPWAFSRVGQRVCIWRGPLAGLEGILLRKHDDFQVVVGVEALQRSVAVEINHEMVRAVEGAPHAQMARLFMTA
jgi:transcription antitermination factor NusG